MTIKKDNKIEKKDIKKKSNRKKNNKKNDNCNKKRDSKKIIVDKIKIKENKEVYSHREVIVIMLFSLGIGFIMCFGCMSLLVGKNYISIARDLDKVVDTYYAIVDNYYGDLDKDKLVDSAVEGMISSVGDVFTSYTDATDTESFNDTIKGSYEGIGCTVATYTNGNIVIIDVFDGSPSDKAGIKEGDVVIKVDGISYEDKTSTELSEYIKNSGKDKVILTIVRDDNEMDIEINLSKVEIPSVSGQIIEKEDNKIGYISMSIFANNSYDQFKDKLEELEKDDIDGLIIDVRDNSGGYLTTVTDICNLFLEKGKVIYQLNDSETSKKKMTKDTTKEKREYDIVVLVNGGSASASEVLASAIKESYGGIIVGTTSYGKGTVQQTKKLLDGSMIKYTTQKWFTPNGNSINDVGIVPDYVVELNDEYYSNPSDDSDNQLQEAINLLIK